MLFALGSSLFGAAGICYSRYMESQWLDLDEVGVTIPGKKLAGPIRILHMSDFHASSVVPLGYIEEAIRLGLSAEPDLICVTGDFYTATDFDRDEYVRILKLLSGAAPAFACFGNHDGGPWIKKRRRGFPDMEFACRLMSDCGIVHLNNRSRPVTIKGQALHLVGLGDFLAGLGEHSEYFDPPAAFRDVPDEADHPVLLLSHNPDSKKTLERFHWNLMLCGHTHGGQLHVPLLGTPFAPVMDKRYVRGLNPWKDRQIYTTKALFTQEVPIRISDINYGNHLGHDTMVSIFHEARVAFFRAFDMEECDVDGLGILVVDLAVQYRAQAFYGQTLNVEVAAADAGSRGCDLVYRASDRESGEVVALGKTGIVFFDYGKGKVKSMPARFRAAIGAGE